MKISLINAGKRFNRDWIFRNFHYEFNAGIAYAITGPNGSGKSTLLQVIGGAVAQPFSIAGVDASPRDLSDAPAATVPTASIAATSSGA